MPRPKHPDKDLEAVLRSAEKQGWKIEKRKYFKMKCPCGKHIKTVHMTPSNPKYCRELIQQLERATCWEEEQ